MVKGHTETTHPGVHDMPELIATLRINIGREPDGTFHAWTAGGNAHHGYHATDPYVATLHAVGRLARYEAEEQASEGNGTVDPILLQFPH